MASLYFSTASASLNEVHGARPRVRSSWEVCWSGIRPDGYLQAPTPAKHHRNRNKRRKALECAVAPGSLLFLFFDIVHSPTAPRLNAIIKNIVTPPHASIIYILHLCALQNKSLHKCPLVMAASIMGHGSVWWISVQERTHPQHMTHKQHEPWSLAKFPGCLLYTSDAADD